MSIRRPRKAPKNGDAPAEGAGPESNPVAPERRSEILAIAARHFAEHGFEATTIRQISDEAGILSGSLYYHFASKEEILHEIMRPFVSLLISKYEEISELPDAADVMASNMLRFSLQQIEKNPDQHAILFNDRKYFRRTKQFSYVSSLGNVISHIWYGVIQQGVRDGAFRPDINIRLTTTVILKLINATADWYDPAGHDSLDAMIEAQQALILNGLRAHAPRRPAAKAARSVGG